MAMNLETQYLLRIKRKKKFRSRIGQGLLSDNVA
jgi:hypothetical protein